MQLDLCPTPQSFPDLVATLAPDAGPSKDLPSHGQHTDLLGAGCFKAAADLGSAQVGVKVGLEGHALQRIPGRHAGAIGMVHEKVPSLDGLLPPRLHMSVNLATEASTAQGGQVPSRWCAPFSVRKDS